MKPLTPINVACATPLSTDEYFAMDAVNQSLLKQVLRSPAHAAEYIKGDKAPTAAMQFGTAVHASLLNPDNFDNEVAILPEEINRRTKEGKEQYAKFLARADGKVIINREQSVDCIRIGFEIARSDTASRLINSCNHEMSYTWVDELTKMACKARLDVVCGSSKHVVDLKTTVNASPQDFGRSVYKFGYHIQAAWYLRAASGFATGSKAYNSGWRFHIVAVESSAPYGVACYKLDHRAIIEGDKMADRALKAWAECKLLGEFCGYPDEVTSLSLPPWALTEPEGDKA